MMKSQHPVLRQADRWLDLCIPISSALLLAAQPLAAYSVLGFWLAARLCLQSAQQPIFLIFLCLALTNMGAVVLERGSQPSDASDFLIISLSFAAGVQRPKEQWHRSLAQISLCLLPIAIAACLKTPETLLQFPDINVNRLSFLLGLLITMIWGLIQISDTAKARLAWMAWMSMALPLVLLSGSRAPLILPTLGIAIAVLLTRKLTNRDSPDGTGRPLWQKVLAVITGIAILAAGATQFWYHKAADSGINRVSDTWRTTTALCWAKQPFTEGVPWLGLGHVNKIRKHCDSKKLPAMQDVINNSTLTEEQTKIATQAAAKGLPHAHNTYAQILAETGLVGLGAVAIAAMWIARTVQRPRLTPANKQTSRDGLVLRAALPIAVYLAIAGATTSFHLYLPLNQILIGYLMATFSARPAEREASI
jgi:hypothetical protein